MVKPDASNTTSKQQSTVLTEKTKEKSCSRRAEVKSSGPWQRIGASSARLSRVSVGVRTDSQDPHELNAIDVQYYSGLLLGHRKKSRMHEVLNEIYL